MINTAPILATFCIGDSLNSGAGATSAATTSATTGPYPAQLRMRGHGRPVATRSYPSQNAQYIRNKALADGIYSQWTNVIWAGTNNISVDGALSDVLSSVADIVGNLTHSRFVILSPLAPSTFQSGHVYWQQRADISAALLAAYPSNYLDVHADLLAAGPAGDSTDGGSSVGTVHTSLRFDSLHLNDAGYEVTADSVDAFLLAKGW